MSSSNSCAASFIILSKTDPMWIVGSRLRRLNHVIRTVKLYC